MKKYFIQVILYLMEKNGKAARLLFRLAAPLGKTIRKYKVVDFEWMDVCFASVDNIVREGGAGVAYGPMCLGYDRPRKSVVQLPEVCYYTFKNGVVSATSSSVLQNNGVLAIERVGRYESSDFDYSAGHVHMHRGKSALIKRINIEQIEKGIFLGGNGAFNYYHWLIEIVPKIEFLGKLPDKYHDFPLLVSCEVFNIPSFGSILAKFAPGHQIVALDSHRAYDVKELIYISTPNSLPFNLRAGTKIRNLAYPDTSGLDRLYPGEMPDA